jgi:hypothetical protein
MKLAFLMLLFAFPAPQTATGNYKIGADGSYIVRFKHPFPDDSLKCTVTKGPGRVRAWTRESIHVIGNPGERGSWRCE